MAEITTSNGPNIVAVYADHEHAESAIRRLHKDGFALDELSIVGRDIQVTEEPRGFVSTADYVSAGRGPGLLREGSRASPWGLPFCSCRESAQSWWQGHSPLPCSRASRVPLRVLLWVPSAGH